MAPSLNIINGDSLTLKVARTCSRLVKYTHSWVARRNLRHLNGKITCLLYHRIVSQSDHPWLEAGGVPYTSPSAFHDQLAELVRLGGEFFTLDDVNQGEKPASNRPGFVISFDDGFRDNFEVRRSILDEFGIRGVFFITASLPERDTLLWEHLLFWLTSVPQYDTALKQQLLEKLDSPLENLSTAELARNYASPKLIDMCLEKVVRSIPVNSIPNPTILYATWNLIRDAATAGHQIGTHTTSHRMRHTMTKEQFQLEFERSMEILSEKLEVSPTAFS